MKAVFIFIVGIFALAGAGACAIATGISTTPPAPTQTTIQFSTPPSPPATQANDAADSTFTLSESDLNRQIANGLSQGEISDARVDVHPDNLADFSATIRTGNLTLQPTVSIQLSVRDGRMVIDVLDVKVGGFGVPSSLIGPQIAQIEQTAETELNQLFAANQDDTGLKLQSLSTSEDSLTLYFAP